MTVGQEPSTSNHISNADLLRTIFGDQYLRAHVCGFVDDPSDLDNQGKGHLWAGGAFEHEQYAWPGDHVQPNQFWCISLFRGPQRRKHLFEGMYALVIDDVGTGPSAKIPPDDVLMQLGAPGIALETSPGNEQWIYRFTKPIASRAAAEMVLSRAIERICHGEDPGMNGVTRYVRLPEGWNSKAKYVGPDGRKFKCRITRWHAELSWEPGEIMLALGLTESDIVAAQTSAAHTREVAPEGEDFWLQALSRLGRVKGISANRGEHVWYDIICPWVDEHGGREDTGAAYASPEGFKCWHGHCQDRTFRDLREWIEAQEGGQTLDEVREETAARQFHGLADPGVVEHLRAQQQVVKVEQQQRAEKFEGGWCRFDEKKPFLDSSGIVHGLLAHNALAVLYGTPGAGKSFAALELAHCVASGREFFGLEVDPVPVAYLAAEGGVSFDNRCVALRIEHGPAPGLMVNINPLVLDVSLADQGENDLKRLVEIFDRWRADHAWTPGLVIIDTLARVMHGDENSAQDMGRLVRAGDALRERYGCTVLFIHHTGKAAEKGARGSSALLAAVDTEILVFSDGPKSTDIRTILATKQRGYDVREASTFRLKKIAVGICQQSQDQITSCVVEEFDADDDGRVKVRITAKETGLRRAWRVVTQDELLPEKRQELDDGNSYLKLEDVVETIVAQDTSKAAATKKRIRARDSIDRLGERSAVVIRHIGESAWVRVNEDVKIFFGREKPTPPK